MKTLIRLFTLLALLFVTIGFTESVTFARSPGRSNGRARVVRRDAGRHHRHYRRWRNWRRYRRRHFRNRRWWFYYYGRRWYRPRYGLRYWYRR